MSCIFFFIYCWHFSIICGEIDSNYILSEAIMIISTTFFRAFNKIFFFSFVFICYLFVLYLLWWIYYPVHNLIFLIWTYEAFIKSIKRILNNYNKVSFIIWLFIDLNIRDSRRGASDSVTDSLVLSNHTDAQNVSCLGLCGRDICSKSSA